MKKLMIVLLFIIGCSKQSSIDPAMAGVIFAIGSQPVTSTAASIDPVATVDPNTGTVSTNTTNQTQVIIPDPINMGLIDKYQCYIYDSGTIYGMDSITKNPVVLQWLTQETHFVISDFYKSIDGFIVIIGDEINNSTGSTAHRIFVHSQTDVTLATTEPERVANPLWYYNTSTWRIGINYYYDLQIAELFNKTAGTPADRYYQINYICNTDSGAWYSTEQGNGGITRPAGAYYWYNSRTAPDYQGVFQKIY